MGGAGSLGANKNIVIDGVRPTVLSINRQNPMTTTSATNSVMYRVTFSKAVQNVGVNDFVLTTTTGTANGTIAFVSATTGTSIDVTVNGITGAGTLRLDLATGAIVNDLLGNALTTAFTTGQTYDFVAPTVLSINRQTPTTADAINNTSVVYWVTFSKAVQNVDIADFVLTKTGTANGTIASVSTSTGASIDVTVSGITGAGTLRLDVPPTNTINDNLGNITAAYSAGQFYTIDRIAPTVVSILRQTPLNIAVSTTRVSYAVTFSENITGLDANDFVVTNDGTGGVISNVSVSGNIATVEISQIRSVGTLRLDLLATATLSDLAGNPFVGGLTIGETYNIVFTPLVGVVAQAGSGNVTLSWSSVLFANNYEIYMFSANSPQRLVGNTANTTFTVAGLENTITYFFRVVVSGSSEFSTTVSARPSIILGTEEEAANTLFQ
ncbi:MAG: fibronectin type III domain-containing protein, partial [Oscillatoriales cyanobacterium]